MIESVEIEKIKRLKYRYMKALDTHNWGVFRSCFAIDATASYSDGDLSFQGRDAITEGISSALDYPMKICAHQVHHPRINLLSESIAEGEWYLQDFVICEQEGWILHGAAFYQDNYVKQDEQWIYSHIGYQRSFEYRVPIPEGAYFNVLAEYLRGS